MPVSQRSFQFAFVLVVAAWGFVGKVLAEDPEFRVWQTTAPRDELRPEFSFKPDGGRGDLARLIITQDDREGLLGAWKKTFPVDGGKFYRFEAYHREQNVETPRRSASARILWQGDAGKSVLSDMPDVEGYLIGAKAVAHAEYPLDQGTDQEGWTEVSEVISAPSQATQAVIELNGMWAPRSVIEWTEPKFVAVSKPEGRKVRLAAVHYKPHGPNPLDNRKQYRPFIKEAAEKKADLVVLGETLTIINTRLTYADVAEPIPGPSTEFFGEQAKEHGLYIVAGLVERDGPLLYNVAVLIDPQGNVAGKYRKVCPPRSEVDGGISPGHEYPVFDTSFGKLGMMICYDGFFPEVARELTANGAEVIAFPVWGCNTMLARARACENHVYIVSSTYEAYPRNWMLTAVFDHAGETRAEAKEFGEVIVAEVDLNARIKWGGLGDFKGVLPHFRPIGSRD